MKTIRYGLLIAVLVAGSISFSVSDTAWAKGTSKKTTYKPRTNPLLQKNSKSDHQDELSVQLEMTYTYYHPQMKYTTSAVPPVEKMAAEKPNASDAPPLPVSKRYNANFIKSAVPAPVATQTPVVIAETAEGKAALISQTYGIPVTDLQGLTLSDLKELDAKIQCIQRLKATYNVSDAQVVHKSLSDLRNMEAKLATGRN